MKIRKVEKDKIDPELQLPFVAKLTRENLRMLKRALKYASCKVGKDKRGIRT